MTIVQTNLLLVFFFCYIFFSTQGKPPPYPIECLAVPLTLFSCEGVILAAPEDTSTKKLGSNLFFQYVVTQKDFKHLDFMAGYQAASFLHVSMIRSLERMQLR